MKKSHLIIMMITAFALMLSFTGCSKPQGKLIGRIEIGPLCPVERSPSDPGCIATNETYKEWQLAVYSKDGNREVAKIMPDKNGRYQIDLDEGTYVVDFVTQPYISGRSAIPAEVTIESNETSLLNINIDTGIR